eukprot:COSAG01_NODE_1254_length_11042_cov_37.493192_2_plen_225_part_00
MSLAGIGGYASSPSSDDDEAPAAVKRVRSSSSDSGGDDESSSGNDSDSDAERRRRKRRAAASTAAAAATAGGLGPSVDDLFASTSSSFLASTVSRAPVIPLCTQVAAHSALPKACALSCDDAAARRVGSLRGTDGGSGPRAGGRGGAGGAGGSGEGRPDAAGGGGGRGAGQEQRPNGQGGGGSQAGRCAFRTVVAGVCYGLRAPAFCAWWCDGMLVGTSSPRDD